MRTRKATDAAERMADYEDEILRLKAERDQEQEARRGRASFGAEAQKAPPRRPEAGAGTDTETGPGSGNARPSTSPAPAAGGPPSRPPSRPALSLHRALSLTLSNATYASRPSSTSTTTTTNSISNAPYPHSQQVHPSDARPPPTALSSYGSRLSSFLRAGRSSLHSPSSQPSSTHPHPQQRPQPQPPLSATSTFTNTSGGTLPSMPNSGNIVASGSDVGLPSPFPLMSPAGMGVELPEGLEASFFPSGAAASSGSPPPAPALPAKDARPLLLRTLSPAAPISEHSSSSFPRPLASPQTLTTLLHAEVSRRTTAEQRLSSTQSTLQQTQSTLQTTHAQLQQARAALNAHTTQAAAEIEDLSASLFGQANEMVAAERRARAKLEERVRVLEGREEGRRGRLEGLERRVALVGRVRAVLGEEG